MNRKRFATILALVALFCVPAQAGSFGVYGSWDSDQATNSTGGGARIGFTFVKVLELDFHGSYYPDFKTDVGGRASMSGRSQGTAVSGSTSSPAGFAANAGFTWRWGR